MQRQGIEQSIAREIDGTPFSETAQGRDRLYPEQARSARISGNFYTPRSVWTSST